MIIQAAIIGASGYTGVELVRLLSQHPKVVIKALGANRNAGQRMAEIFPHLSRLELPVLQKTEEIDWSGLDVVFCCLETPWKHPDIAEALEAAGSRRWR